jgi:hypothetical protein
MALFPLAPLADVDKLIALRRVDQFREWRSLDDQRYCLVCGKIITGGQIQVAGSTRGNGPLELSCPTELCNSIPMDWVLLTNENLAVANAAEFKERSVAPPTAADHGAAHDPTSQLSNFGVYFKPAS